MIHSPEKVEGRQCGFTLLLNTVIQIPAPGMSLIKDGLRGKTRLSHGPDEGKNNSGQALNCHQSAVNTFHLNHRGCARSDGSYWSFIIRRIILITRSAHARLTSYRCAKATQRRPKTKRTCISFSVQVSNTLQLIAWMDITPHTPHKAHRRLEILRLLINRLIGCRVTPESMGTLWRHKSKSFFPLKFFSLTVPIGSYFYRLNP